MNVTTLTEILTLPTNRSNHSNRSNQQTSNQPNLCIIADLNKESFHQLHQVASEWEVPLSVYIFLFSVQRKKINRYGPMKEYRDNQGNLCTRVSLFSDCKIWSHFFVIGRSSAMLWQNLLLFAYDNGVLDCEHSPRSRFGRCLRHLSSSWFWWYLRSSFDRRA
jgi:hypothetical protein